MWDLLINCGIILNNGEMLDSFRKTTQYTWVIVNKLYLSINVIKYAKWWNDSIIMHVVPLFTSIYTDMLARWLYNTICIIILILTLQSATWAYAACIIDSYRHVGTPELDTFWNSMNSWQFCIKTWNHATHTVFHMFQKSWCLYINLISL